MPIREKNEQRKNVNIKKKMRSARRHNTGGNKCTESKINTGAGKKGKKQEMENDAGMSTAATGLEL